MTTTRLGWDVALRALWHSRQHAVTAPSKFRQDIQGLRALAVGIVVLDHAHVPGLSGGFIGVDVFFVISGFLITGLLLGDIAKHARVRFLNFYSRRAQRILPAATVVIVVTCVASIALLGIIQARSVLVDGVWAVFFGANMHSPRSAPTISPRRRARRHSSTTGHLPSRSSSTLCGPPCWDGRVGFS